MPTTMPNLVSSVERLLSDYYAFTPIAEAHSFLLDDLSLKQLSETERINPEDFSPGRGSVIFLNEKNDEEMFIGVHIADKIVAMLEGNDPITNLDGKNLDHFCVLVEELSHFHLILNRIADGKTVSRLELEWQAEIDKLLISSILLKEQSGKAHKPQLSLVLFDHATTLSSNKELYDTATKYAAKFWRNVAADNNWHDSEVRQFLLKNYHLSWDAKRSNIENLRSA